MTTTTGSARNYTERLTAAEEQDLARTMEAGVLAADADTYGAEATPAEIAALVRAGQAARERFLLANHGLVVTIALEEVKGSSATLDELVQEGYIGLAQALMRYDYRRGRFGPFAAAWVRQLVRGAALTGCGRSVLTRRQTALLSEVRTAEADLSQRLGREADAAEIGACARIDVGTVERLRGARIVGGADVLDIVDTRASEALTAVEQVTVDVAELLDHLTPLQRAVVTARCGLGCEPESYAAVGEQLGVSATTVRRVEQRALGLLRRVLGSTEVAA